MIIIIMNVSKTKQNNKTKQYNKQQKANKQANKPIINEINK